MKRGLIFLIAVVISGTVTALDLGHGLSLNGGVKTGLMVKNSNYANKLNGITRENAYPMTVYFGSQENETYNGEGWLEFAFSREKWGLKLGTWAHGDLNKWDDLVHLGDHFIWANYFENKLKLIGGQGGGTPISSGGWLNAEWLGERGIRVFWIDPLGFSIGINFPDPGKTRNPANYLSTIMVGAKYRFNNFWISMLWDNNPIYDDSEANTDGGLHRDPKDKPIAQNGNIAFGIGLDPLFDGKGVAAIDGTITNLGESDEASPGITNYKVSPIETTITLKAGYSFIEKLYTELRIKYNFREGDNDERTGTATWRRFTFEPYARYQIFNHLKFDISLNTILYSNSYYLSVEEVTVGGNNVKTNKDGWVGPYLWLLDYLSGYQMTIKPALTFEPWEKVKIILGYIGKFSRDHVENTLYVDFRWSF